MSKKQKQQAAVFLAAAAVIIIVCLQIYRRSSVKESGTAKETEAITSQAAGEETVSETVSGAVSGTFTGVSNGFGGEIQVSITVEHGVITECSIDGSKESADVGGKYIKQFEEEIVEKNGTVDTVSGATVTSNGVNAALQKALASAGLGDDTQYSMKPGTYIGKAHGFSNIDYVVVEVKVSDTEIEKADLVDTFREDEDSYENRYMCQGAFETLGAEIVESQSIGMDGVTGATGSSNGIKSAVRDALKQAYMANGFDEQQADTAVNQKFADYKAEKSDQVVELHYDVVVAGAGAAGTVASLTALDEGASVLNIEKTFRWGGQSMLTGGPKAYNPATTDEQAEAIYEEYAATIERHRYGEEDQKWNDPDYRKAHEEEYQPVNKEAYKAAVPASGKGIKTIIEHGMHFVESSFDFAAMSTGEGGMPEVAAGEGMVPGEGGMPEMAMGKGRMEDIDMSALMKVDDSKSIGPEAVDLFDSSGAGNNLAYSMAEEYYEQVFESYVEGGGDYLLNTTVKELMYEDDTKSKITGVRAYGKDGTTYEVYADAVILATGGYGGNEELMDQWAAGGEDWIYYGWQGNDGDGILMALDAGANPYNLKAYPMSHQRMGSQFITKFEVQKTEDGREWSPNDLTVVLAVNNDGVYVKTDGTNFITDNMGTMGGFSGSMGTYYIGSSYYVVYSQEQLEEYRTKGISDTTMGFQNVGEGIPVNYPLGDWVDTVLDEAAVQGWAWKVDSLEEGDKLLGFEEGTLQKAYAEDGTEKNNGQSDSYVIMKCCGLAISSCGGVEVNENMQAVRKDGTVIENLFIAGNDGFGNIMATGAEYPIGGDAGMFVFGSGSIAGEKAARLSTK